MVIGAGETLGVTAIMQVGTTLGLTRSSILGTMDMQAGMAVGTTLGIMDGVVVTDLGTGVAR